MEVPATELALRLPADRATGAVPGRARVAVAWSRDHEPLVVAAFAAWLARESGQAEIPFETARVDLRGVRRAKLATIALEGDAGAMTGASLVAAVESELAMRPAAAHASPAAIAAITWCESTLHELVDAGRDVHLIVWPASAELAYASDRFSATAAERLAGHLATITRALADDLDAEVAQLPLLTASERAWLDDIGRGGPREVPAELAHARFARIAGETPDAIAVRYREHQLTYRELAERAARLAHELVARGAAGHAAGADHARVAVCLEPGLDIAIALLAALFAGAAYVPIDPTYPPARIRAILDDTAPIAVITRSALVGKLELPVDAALALDRAELAAHPATPPVLAVAPTHTAYIYYTSGTTGRPKGVMASHANLAFYLQVARDRYAIAADDVIPAIARFGFSISMFELMSPLTAGGTLVVLDRDHVLDPARMATTLDDVTLFHAGPSLLKHLLPHLERTRSPESYPRVRHASSGGDLIAPALLAKLATIFHAAEIFVIYGSSEISCMGCTYPVSRSALPTKTFVGRPFPDVTVRLLDGHGELVPAGVIGEIHFAGGGVVAGYLNRPELTIERFVDWHGERLYRMGDMGRWSADGWLEILGRNDFQIKVRGMRVELGEVDLHVRGAPGVKDAVVVARDAGDGTEPSGERIMVAYVVLAEPGRDDGDRAERFAQIRRYLADRVPEYMIPATYVELAALPVNHNMKLDRNALPPYVPAARAARTASAARLRRPPESATEAAIARIWTRVLGVDAVSLDDNFFELGGDSMHALELITSAQAAIGVELDGMDVLRESLEVLARAADRALGKAVPVRAPVAPAAPRVPVRGFHFGRDRDLYGVIHGETARARTAVVICPPIGQERIRTQFVLGRLARQLAAAGAPTMRFDWYGTGDSYGDDLDATLARWRRDIDDALAELAQRTGATEIVAIGVRLGATLLAHAAVRARAHRIVLWDPIISGAGHRRELVAHHAALVRGMQHLRLGTQPAPIQGGSELLGTGFSLATLRELDALTLPIRTADTPTIRWLSTHDRAEARAAFTALAGDDRAAKLESLAIDCAWTSLARLEDQLPDTGLSRALAQLAEAAPEVAR